MHGHWSIFPVSLGSNVPGVRDVLALTTLGEDLETAVSESRIGGDAALCSIALDVIDPVSDKAFIRLGNEVIK